jgi:hypothetical protein
VTRGKYQSNSVARRAAFPSPEWSNLRFDLPTTLSATARAGAMAASARLRTERRFVPAATIEVPTPRGTLVFAPLSETDNPLEARFTFTHANGRFAGALRLKRPGDPLTLRVQSSSPDTLLGEAWAAALIVYAALTCVEIPSREHADPSPASLKATAPARPTLRAHPTASPRARSPHRRRGDVAVSDRALAVREAISRIEAVSGHLRRLRPSTAASPEARRAASLAGIRIPRGYTWVRPHQRGAGGQRVCVAWPRTDMLW